MGSRRCPTFPVKEESKEQQRQGRIVSVVRRRKSTSKSQTGNIGEWQKKWLKLPAVTALSNRWLLSIHSVLHATIRSFSAWLLIHQVSYTGYQKGPGRNLKHLTRTPKAWRHTSQCSSKPTKGRSSTTAAAPPLAVSLCCYFCQQCFQRHNFFSWRQYQWRVSHKRHGRSVRCILDSSPYSVKCSKVNTK